VLGDRRHRAERDQWIGPELALRVPAIAAARGDVRTDDDVLADRDRREAELLGPDRVPQDVPEPVLEEPAWRADRDAEAPPADGRVRPLLTLPDSGAPVS
jgi:hypothetical protein